MRNSILNELRKSLPAFQPQIIFDVGGNTGQSVSEFAASYPNARIITFEPIAATFRVLEAHCKKYPNAECVNVALGANTGTVKMRSAGTSAANRVIKDPANDTLSLEDVRIETGDSFCARKHLRRLDFLKIDAEGHDFEVLKGFIQMLCQSDIDLLQIECSLNPDNRKHVPLAAIQSFMEPLGYRLFGLFGQKRHRRNPSLALFGDAAFISPSFASSFKAPLP